MEIPGAITQTVVAPEESLFPLGETIEELAGFFAVEFSLFDGETGELLHASDQQPLGDELALAELVCAVARDGRPQFIAEADGVVMLALPQTGPAGRCCVAVAPFATHRPDSEQSCQDAARLLAITPSQAWQWARAQDEWQAHALLRLAEAVLAKQAAEANSARMASEVDLVSQNLATTYEEICLLYSMTQNLRLSSSDEELGRLATERMVECIPAEAVAVQLLPLGEEDQAAYKTRKRAVLTTSGDCPVDNDEFSRLIDYLGLAAGCEPYVANERVTNEPSWPFPGIRQLIVVSVSEGENAFGWLAAFNHVENDELGTVEAQLLNSVGALLGIHSSNRELYRQQAEFLANVVRALVSAIDAKDPYTSGHSDRVARLAVRLALELRCNPKLVNTIYMAGLLHDVGKIGIDDSVLRKAGHLTDVEYEHIKKHPEMGHRILSDLKQLSDVLPAVLHHHEQWNGRGYPHGLAGEQIPLIARIMAVADAYDAMTSDRPYRAGMDEAKVDGIFQQGAGKHWDPQVVKAYFAAKEDMESIARRERAQLAHPSREQWT